MVFSKVFFRKIVILLKWNNCFLKLYFKNRSFNEKNVSFSKSQDRSNNFNLLVFLLPFVFKKRYFFNFSDRTIHFVRSSFFFSNIYFLEVAEIMVYQHLRDIYNECYTPRWTGLKLNSELNFKKHRNRKNSLILNKFQAWKFGIFNGNLLKPRKNNFLALD